jgi:hypothetical protein
VSNQISLNPSSIARSLGVCTLILVLASIFTQLATYITTDEYIYKLSLLFYVDAERNIPTFFSSCLLLSSALLFLVITLIERSRATRYVKYWMTLSCGFLLMAIDEVVSLHEQLAIPIRNLLGNIKLGIFYYAWVIPGIILVLVLSVFFWKFLAHLSKKMRRDLLTAAAIYLSGCIGFEMIGGYYAEIHGSHNLIYSALSTIEESLEMAGSIVLIRVILVYIKDNYQEVKFVFARVHQKV